MKALPTLALLAAIAGVPSPTLAATVYCAMPQNLFGREREIDSTLKYLTCRQDHLWAFMLGMPEDLADILTDLRSEQEQQASKIDDASSLIDELQSKISDLESRIDTLETNAR